eukprot:PhF_6_TR41829/c0_g1_i1/m.63434
MATNAMAPMIDALINALKVTPGLHAVKWEGFSPRPHPYHCDILGLLEHGAKDSDRPKVTQIACSALIKGIPCEPVPNLSPKRVVLHTKPNALVMLIGIESARDGQGKWEEDEITLAWGGDVYGYKKSLPPIVLSAAAQQMSYILRNMDKKHSPGEMFWLAVCEKAFKEKPHIRLTPELSDYAMKIGSSVTKLPNPANPRENLADNGRVRAFQDVFRTRTN